MPGDFSDLIKDYDFDLPDSLIAQRPSEKQDEARLLVVRRNPSGGLPRFEDLKVKDLPDLLAQTLELRDLCWVRNRSRVFPARFYARRPSGGRHEIVLLEPIKNRPGIWKALIRGQGDFRYPQTLFTDSEERLEISSPEVGLVDLSGLGADPLTYLKKRGEMPLPPYIKERIRETDFDRYQPLWADPKKSGSAAAPTASLHFSESLVEKLGPIKWLDTYLHVGLGTFEPYRHDKLSAGEIHSEKIEVPLETLNELKRRRALAPNKKFCLSVGTTALRCLESLNPLDPTQPSEWHRDFEFDSSLGISARTQAFVKPGFEFHWTQALWTNFHLPKSTLLVLVATFSGSRQLALEAYQHAIKRNYRFFSYGDASLWI